MNHIVAARRRMEAKLSGSCVIAADGEATYDPDTMATDWADGQPVYEGPCSIAPERDGRRSEQGERQTGTGAWVVMIPMSVTGVERGMKVAVDAADDPMLVGRDLVVDVVVTRTTGVLRRLRCVDTLQSDARVP